MKTLLITLLLFFGMKSYGQDSHLKIASNNAIKYYDILVFTDFGFNAQINKVSDTLEITSTGRIKFIKIGDRVYKIESPTLTDIKENVGIGYLIPYTQYWHRITPAFTGIIDTNTTRMIKQP